MRRARYVRAFDYSQNVGQRSLNFPGHNYVGFVPISNLFCFCFLMRNAVL